MTSKTFLPSLACSCSCLFFRTDLINNLLPLLLLLLFTFFLFLPSHDAASSPARPYHPASLKCFQPKLLHPILCSLLCLHAKLHCKSVPSLPLLIPSFSKPNRERGTTGVWTASASYCSRTTPPTNTTRYKYFTDENA